jgi:GT2 family glycosyltransferase
VIVTSETGRLDSAAHHDGVVVVLSWHGRRDTLACVESLLADPEPATVLVVDNGSFDGVLEEVAERWPEVHTLQTGTNLGFAGGMNRGIHWALDRGARFITVLNNDTIVPVGTIGRLQRVAAGRRAVSPEVLYRDRPDELWFGGSSLDDRLMFPFHTPTEALEPPVDGLRVTRLLAGCCITASARVWHDVGLFDERFFLNFEDSEWSLRARRAGVELVVDCTVGILHAVSASFVREAAYLSTFYFVRNGLLFNRLGGGTVRSRLGFLRHTASLVITASVRSGQPKRAARHAVMAAWAVASHLLRRYGPAPRMLHRLASGWRT